MLPYKIAPSHRLYDLPRRAPPGRVYSLSPQDAEAGQRKGGRVVAPVTMRRGFGRPLVFIRRTN